MKNSKIQSTANKTSFKNAHQRKNKIELETNTYPPPKSHVDCSLGNAALKKDRVRSGRDKIIGSDFKVSRGRGRVITVIYNTLRGNTTSKANTRS